MIEGNLYDLTPKQRKKASRERIIWLIKNPYTWLMIIALIFFVVYFTNYLIPTLDKQAKQMTCLNNGYYDYESSTNTCYELYGTHADFKCGEEGKCKGRN